MPEIQGNKASNLVGFITMEKLKWKLEEAAWIGRFVTNMNIQTP